MAKDFDLHSNDKGKNGQRPSRRDVIPFDSGRRGRNDFQPIDSIRQRPESHGGDSGHGVWQAQDPYSFWGSLFYAGCIPP